MMCFMSLSHEYLTKKQLFKRGGGRKEKREGMSLERREQGK